MHRTDSPRLWPFYSEDAIERVTRRVRVGNLSATGLDPDIGKCEQRIASQLVPGSHVLLCNSGTSALASAYIGLRLDQGAEVLVPSHTFRATVTPLIAAGLRPVLCDTDARTGNIDLEDARHRIGPRTQALVITHVWGRPVPLAQARELADQYGLALVEDCSHAHGTRWGGTPVGTIGDVAVFSLGTTKMVSGGLAGALATRDRGLYERAMVFGQPKHRGMAEVEDPVLRALLATGLGHNLRVSPVAAILVQDHLDRLPLTVEIRNANFARLEAVLHRHLPELVPLALDTSRTTGTLYKFHARWTGASSPAAEVIALLSAAGVRVRKPAGPLHTTPLFTDPDLLSAVWLGGIAPRPVDPAEYPGTEAFLNSLVELDARDLYEESQESSARYERAVEKVSETLAEPSVTC